MRAVTALCLVFVLIESPLYLPAAGLREIKEEGAPSVCLSSVLVGHFDNLLRFVPVSFAAGVTLNLEAPSRAVFNSGSVTDEEILL